MPVSADCHMHSVHSGDSEAPMEEMILQSIAKGLDTICFTEHIDLDFPVTDLDPEGKFECDMDEYYKDYCICRERYSDKIRILFGTELGLQPSVADRNKAYAKAYDLDLIIGSSHLCNGADPSCTDFYRGRSEKEAYREYFDSILENITTFSDFDVYGHLDYVVRYGPNADKEYSYDTYRDILDRILMLLIEKGKGIEINTGGLKKGLRDVHPCTDVIRRYKSLGGEIITIGSDAHIPENIAAYFSRAEEILNICGFRYYTVFEHRRPRFVKL
ncbi:MAG: histidinol-phosphatase HisJ family protein [Oscillospiraceae bacterium]|nr:histidinol-phosphatase HisJ family protein [Oscillospiraceae bacterium]